MEYYALIDNSLKKETYLFTNPQRFLVCYRPDEVETKLAEMEEAVNAGYYVVGYFAYELGECFEERFAAQMPEQMDFPLFHLAVFRPEDRRPIDDDLHELPQGELGTLSYTPNITKEEYISDIERIKEYLRAGDVYQVNYTFKQKLQYDGCPAQLYRRLRQQQRVEYGAFLRFPEYSILSFSPELFFKIEGETITAKPMKGTADKRNGKPAFDLNNDEKNLSENLMIVDLIRNDLSRIARDVRVAKLFEIEEYETLYQLTSTITGVLQKNLSLKNPLKTLHPCGSITGAPKIRAMEVIKQLEKEKRKMYTGALVCITPNREMLVNVAIRTLLLDNKGKGEMGIGSGIVYDSIPEKEYEECLIKAKFLTTNFLL